jgi:hypothetical protein
MAVCPLYRSVDAMAASDLRSQCADVRFSQYAGKIEVHSIERVQHLAWKHLQATLPLPSAEATADQKSDMGQYDHVGVQARYTGWTIRLQLGRSLGRAWPSFKLLRNQYLTCSGSH